MFLSSLQVVVFLTVISFFLFLFCDMARLLKIFDISSPIIYHLSSATRRRFSDICRCLSWKCWLAIIMDHTVLYSDRPSLLKNGPFPASILFDTNWRQLILIKFVADWIQTLDFWCQRQPLYQLSHTHCLKFFITLSLISDAFVSTEYIFCSFQVYWNLLTNKADLQFSNKIFFHYGQNIKKKRW